MEGTIAPTSLFGHIAARGKIPVARELGGDVRMLHHLCHGKFWISPRMLALCNRAWGDAHDEVATMVESLARHRSYRAARAEGAAA